MSLNVPERYNASLLLDANLEAGRADKVVIRRQDEEVTYAGLFERACRAGQTLAALGAGPGERVLMVMDDSPSFPAVFLGAMRVGAVPVPVAPMYRADDYGYFVSDSQARVVVADAVFADKVRDALESGSRPIEPVVANGEAEGFASLDEISAEHRAEFPPADTHRDDMAFWLYSSGSTGRPKGVVHLHHDILYTCETYAKHVLKIGEGDTTFSTTKLFHAYGLGNNLSFPYWAGGSTVLLSGRPTPEAILETAQRFRPDLLFSVPTLYNMILNWPQAAEYDLSSVRACVSAAEPLPPEVWHRWKGMFGLVILDGIGSTEMLHIYCSNTMEDVRPGSSGRPVPGYAVRLLDESENEITKPNEEGDLWVKGESSFDHYWRKPERTAQCLKDGWFFSGDRYRCDEEGYYHYEGRADDMIKVGGLWVSPIEVENALMEHRVVVEAAAVGVKQEGLTRVKAFIVLKPDHGMTEEDLQQDLREFCKNRLQRYQYPHFIEFVEDLPKTLTGKIQRFKLREQG